MAKKFFDLGDVSTDEKMVKTFENQMPDDGMVAAPTTVESLDETNLVPNTPEIEVLDEIETLDEVDSSKIKDEVKVDKKENKKKTPIIFTNDNKNESSINNNPMGGVVFDESQVSMANTPIMASINDKQINNVGMAEKKVINETNVYNNSKKSKQAPVKKKLNINISFLLFLILILGCFIAFFIGHSETNCSISEEDSGIKTTTTIKIYYLFDYAYLSKYKIEYDFTDIESIDTKSFAARMESTNKDKHNLKIDYDSKNVTISYNKYFKSIRSEGKVKDRSNYKDSGLTCD